MLNKDITHKEVSKLKSFTQIPSLAMNTLPIINVGLGALVGLDVYKEAMRERVSIRNSIAQIRDNAEKNEQSEQPKLK